MKVDLEHLPKARLDFIKPMLAKPGDRLPSGSNWVYELKLDGYRTLQHSRFTADALYFYAFDLLAYQGRDLRKFTEWTRGNHLRHSRCVALRDDKKPFEVVKETAV